MKYRKISVWVLKSKHLQLWSSKAFLTTPIAAYICLLSMKQSVSISMKRAFSMVLFVDDSLAEPERHQGWQRLLQEVREAWQMNQVAQRVAT